MKKGKGYGQNLREARKSVGVKAAELAALTNVTEQQIWRIEQQNKLTTSIKTLLYLRAKGVDINAFLDKYIDENETFSSLKKG